MEFSAIYHRPDSEYAYLYKKDEIHLRLRTKRDDVQAVELEYGDPYIYSLPEYTSHINLEIVASTDFFDFWQVRLKTTIKRLQYTFKITGQDGKTVWFGDYGISHEPTTSDSSALMLYGNYFRLPYVHEIDRVEIPEWVPNTIWYQIFPDRFNNGDPSINPDPLPDWESNERPNNRQHYGGDLQGIIDKLDYLNDLGINGIYLTPIFPAETAHKYDTVNYLEIDPYFGDKNTFCQLVKEAHARDIRVVLDGVFNHIGAHSPQWQDVLVNGEDSPYADWFHIHNFPVSSPNLKRHEIKDYLNYETFAFVPQMPKLNTSHPAVQDYLIGIGEYWIREFDIDGWRLDVANEVDHHFWQEFKRRLRRIKSDIYLVGEIWHTAQAWLDGDEFHGVMNYALTLQVKEYFINGNRTAESFLHAIQAQWMNYRKQTNLAMMNMLDSHDTERLLTSARGHKGKFLSSLAFVFLQQGSPCIYYGTEVGMRGKHDPDCRRPMIWNEEKQDLMIFHQVKELIQFRTQHLDLINSGDVHFEVFGDQAFSMTIEDGRQAAVAYFNNSEEPMAINQPLSVQTSYGLDKNGQLKPHGYVIGIVE